ncbi:pulmonary surfactant-associated protein C [Phasianus colchicus]|uniref:pulmonary surfactant-associated protein C n=1 Tax=Phasianus colchicus TaxID=9054 RepID=UPI00129DEBEE|nr:pulmonary surfactant-associated protein C [Phasianus colchicus]
MERSTKEPLVEEPPPRYSEAAPRPPPVKTVVAAAVLAVLAVLLVVTFLLLGLHLAQAHAETVLRMTIPRDGEGPPQRLSMSPRERTATFAVKEGLNATAVVVFDYGKLLVSYRSWQRRACFVTRVDGDGVPGLDAISQHFQRRETVAAQPIADRSILGTTINILCSTVPIFWA